MVVVESSRTEGEVAESAAGLLRELLVEVRALRGEMHFAGGGIMSCKEAASYLGISQRNLYYLLRQGKIKRVILSPNRFGFRRAELDRYAIEHEEAFSDETEAVVERLFAEASSG